MAIDYVGISTLITAATAAVVSIVGMMRSNQNGADIKRVNEKVGAIEVNTNSMSQRLESAARSDGTAIGRAQGIAEERANPQVDAPKS